MIKKSEKNLTKIIIVVVVTLIEKRKIEIKNKKIRGDVKNWKKEKEK